MGHPRIPIRNPYRSILRIEDANGNILSMKQWGLKGTSSTDIDDMTYSYFLHSNKLRSVTERQATDHKLGDFTDNNPTVDDYDYDENGNLIYDKNKGILAGSSATQGISYNHMNLPATIILPGKGTISYIYDANGTKLEKKVVELAAAKL